MKEYKRVEQFSLGYFEGEREKVASCSCFYPAFHIAPPSGLLNDPNGLCYFQGQHHIFYQCCPTEPAHGLKYWRHVATRDFVSFTDYGLALRPDSDWDLEGAYSGSAFDDDGELLLFYTGNRYRSGQRDPSQLVASLGSRFSCKSKTQIIPFDKARYTQHFRDPFAWKEGDKCFILLGAQRVSDGKGALAFYASSSPLSGWEWLGEITTAFKGHPYMCECPGYRKVGNEFLLYFCAQELKEQSVSSNPSHAVYSVSSSPLDALGLKWRSKSFEEFDFGFDFYAPQVYCDGGGRALLLGWAGTPEGEYPFDAQARWSQMLTLPRELKVQGARILQKPISELKALREEPLVIEGNEVSLPRSSFCLLFDAEEEFSLTFSNKTGSALVFTASKTHYTLDLSKEGAGRSFCGKPYREALRTKAKRQSVELYYDKSILEIFLDSGAVVFTSRVFLKEPTHLSLRGAKSPELFPMRSIGLQYKMP